MPSVEIDYIRRPDPVHELADRIVAEVRRWDAESIENKPVPSVRDLIADRINQWLAIYRLGIQDSR